MTPTTPAQRIVVVGFGMAGGRLVDELLARQSGGRASRRCTVTVVGGEPYPAYNRVLLSDVVAGRADVAALALGDPAGYAAHGVDVRLGTHALAIELPAGGEAGDVLLDDGTRLRFDRLVLATGAAPVVPPLTGLDRDDPPAGVTTLRTVDDAREIVAAAANARRAVVLGGGLLGLEAARGLARRGLDVEVLHAAGHLLAGTLDAAGAGVLARALRRLGVRVRTGAATRAITSSAGRLTGVVLDGDDHVPADLLVIACGVRPRTGLAERAGLAVGRGVLVDDSLASSDPRVLAVGDCAEHRGLTPGLVAPAWEQARVAADLLTGARVAARYLGHRPAVRLKAADVEVAVVGDAAPDPWADEPGLDVVQLLEPAHGRYLKAVVRDGTVVGAAVVGDARAAAELRLLVERGAPAPSRRACLLLPGTRGDGTTAGGADDPTTIPDRATICRCNGVTKGALVRAWSSGARGTAGLAAATRATTGCGTCTDAVAGIAGWLAASDPDAAAPVPQPAAGSPARPAPAPAPSGGSR
ncbi:MAG TPA: FAD-dependent oxidoreductase [Kineosporiaceae bacterium]